MVTIHFKYKGNIFIILHVFSLLYELKKVWTFPFFNFLVFFNISFLNWSHISLTFSSKMMEIHLHSVLLNHAF